jgi:hypothetical protein
MDIYTHTERLILRFEKFIVMSSTVQNVIVNVSSSPIEM